MNRTNKLKSEAKLESPKKDKQTTQSQNSNNIIQSSSSTISCTTINSLDSNTENDIIVLNESLNTPINNLKNTPSKTDKINTPNKKSNFFNLKNSKNNTKSEIYSNWPISTNPDFLKHTYQYTSIFLYYFM